MTTAMESIKEMVDVNTIVGDAVESPDGSVIIPISRVAFGFAAGGGEYSKACTKDAGNERDEDSDSEYGSKFPFAGGSGAGVSINPVAFMVVGNGQIKLLPVNINSSLDKVLDMVPDFLRKVEETMKRNVTVRKDVKYAENGNREKAPEVSNVKTARDPNIILKDDKRPADDVGTE